MPDGVSLDDFARFDREGAQWRRHSSAARVVDVWSDGPDDPHFKLVFFDNLAARPDETRAEIARFVMGPAFRDAFARDPDFNRKRASAKLPMPQEIRAHLEDVLYDEILECAERFGGAALQWAEALGPPRRRGGWRLRRRRRRLALSQPMECRSR